MPRLATDLFAALLTLSLALTLSLSGATRAQSQDQPGEIDSLFDDYAAYDAYVDRMITNRDWAEFISRMGGRDEYSPQQLTKIAADFNGLYPDSFTRRALFREIDLGNGFRQEARAYWGGERYLFFYAIMHERDDALVVLNFSMNSKVSAVMENF